MSGTKSSVLPVGTHGTAVPELGHGWHRTASKDGTKPTAQLAPNQQGKYQTHGTSSTKPAQLAPKWRLLASSCPGTLVARAGWRVAPGGFG